MRIDLLLDEDYYIGITEGGDFDFGGSAQQDVDLLLQSEKGEWRQSPTVGMGIRRFLKKRIGSSPVIDTLPRFIRDAKVELQADGFINPEVIVNEDLSDFKIAVDP
jgi:hypothetical protein